MDAWNVFPASNIGPRLPCRSDLFIPPLRATNLWRSNCSVVSPPRYVIRQRFVNGTGNRDARFDHESRTERRGPTHEATP